MVGACYESKGHMMFLTMIPVLEQEASYLEKEISIALPRCRAAIQTITTEHRAFADETNICIQCSLPLSMEQRRFLTTYGLTFTTQFVES